MVFVVWTRRARWNPGQWRVSAVWCYWPMGTSLSGQYMYIMTSPPPSKNRIIIATTWSNKATRRNNNIVIMIESHLLGGSFPAHTYCCGIWEINIIGHVFIARICIIDCYFHEITIHFLFTETCSSIPFFFLSMFGRLCCIERRMGSIYITLASTDYC